MIYRKSWKVRWPFVAAALIVAAAVLVYLFVIKDDRTPQPSTQTNNPAETEGQPTEPTGWHPSAGSLQKIVENYVSSHSGTYSVVIINPEDGTVLADWRGGEEYFTASIYKLYVAYVGYQKIDDGTYGLDDPYLPGYSRGKCLDVMIRDSHSPCAEKMWNELGKETLTKQMKNLGLKQTSLTGLTTSARDAAIILTKIENGEGLSSNSRGAFLDSMKTQDAKYRRGLPSGFSGGAEVYNKVGWNLLIEWHDTAIVDFSGGKKLVVSVLTKNAGIANVKALASVIESNLPN